MDNIDGTFQLEIDGKERELKCDFAAVECLEKQVLGRSIVQALNEAINELVYMHEVVDVIMTGLKSNRDTRFTREEIGNEVLKNGLAHYVPFLIEYLSYALSGTTEPQVEESDKKK